jgi:alcohol dehydrogenase (NADP+)
VPLAPRRHPCPAGDAPKPFELGAFELIASRRSIGGSLVGGLAETQEMLDFCAKCGIVADVQTIPMQDVNRAYERMLKSEVRYRFSICVASPALIME